MAIVAVSFLPRRPDVYGMYKVEAGIIDNFSALPSTLGKNDVTVTTVICNDRSIPARVFAVMAPHTSAEIEVPDVIGVI